MLNNDCTLGGHCASAYIRPADANTFCSRVFYIRAGVGVHCTPTHVTRVVKLHSRLHKKSLCSYYTEHPYFRAASESIAAEIYVTSLICKKCKKILYFFLIFESSFKCYLTLTCFLKLYAAFELAHKKKSRFTKVSNKIIAENSL